MKTAPLDEFLRWKEQTSRPIEGHRGRCEGIVVSTVSPQSEEEVAREIRVMEMGGYMLQFATAWQTPIADGGRPGLTLVFIRLGHTVQGRLEDDDLPEELR